MIEYQRIEELNSKINNLLEAVRKNHGQFTGIDKDLATNYMREMYELVLAIKPSVIHAVKQVVEVTASTDSMQVEEKTEQPTEVNQPIDEATAIATKVQSEAIEPVKIHTNGTTEVKEDKKLIREVKNTLVENGSKKSISELYAEKKKRINQP